MPTDLVQQKQDAISKRWLDLIYATYSGDGAKFFRREKDQFSNPVGHTMREGTRGIVEGVIGEMDAEKVCSCLKEIIKVRAIQEFSPSQAVSFVFQLREAVRKELGSDEGNPALSAEIDHIDRNIDQAALFAFDVFVKCREQFYELRVNEIKRNVAMIIRRVNREETEEDKEMEIPRDFLGDSDLRRGVDQ